MYHKFNTNFKSYISIKGTQKRFVALVDGYTNLSIPNQMSILGFVWNCVREFKSIFST
jgi:hypothetical protein